MKKQAELFAADVSGLTSRIVEILAEMGTADRVNALNQIRAALHAVSPFASEPVDCVTWVKASTVRANDYNPNAVAPPEMRLLAHSIRSDGYTQPIVASPVEGGDEVIDGFHRHRVGTEVPDVRKRIHGYLPVVRVAAERQERRDRIAATVRHNRARGRHGVNPMSGIVAELHAAGWDDARIAKEMGMDADEVLRLKQITGLAELFRERAYSAAWEPV